MRRVLTNVKLRYASGANQLRNKPMTADSSRPAAVRRNDSELTIVQEIATSGADRPLLMMNLNRYKPEAGFADGALYKAYHTALTKVLPNVGGKILWESAVQGQMVGEQPIHEILAVWYPSHQAFLDLPTVQDADENFRLRGQAVEYAVIHRCDGEIAPLAG